MAGRTKKKTTRKTGTRTSSPAQASVTDYRKSGLGQKFDIPEGATLSSFLSGNGFSTSSTQITLNGDPADDGSVPVSKGDRIVIMATKQTGA